MKTTRIIMLIAVTALVAAACSPAEAEPTTTTTTSTTTTTLPIGSLPAGSVIAEFRTDDGETYRVLLTGPAAEQARAAWDAGTQPGIPNGLIQPGDGGVNVGHEWHVTEVEFAEMAMELCDGTASYIDGLGYDEFVNQHGDRFCPWGAELVDLVEP